MSLKKYQKYFFIAEFKNNEATDKLAAIDKFKKKFGANIEIKLSDNEINSEKSKIIKIDRKESLEDVLINLKNEINDFHIKIYDIEYTELRGENSIKREEKIIFFNQRNVS